MSSKTSIWQDIQTEFKSYFYAPRVFLIALLANGVISVLFFLTSYYLGNYSAALLPAAAATILLWTLADATITNQLVFDKVKAAKELKRSGSIKRLLVVKNLALVLLSVPLVILFGLMLVCIVGKWTELFYGALMTFVLIWGWLGISNALSVMLPFELRNFKEYRRDRHIWISYGILYGLPWVLLPIYGLLMTVPFVLLNWTSAEAAQDHRFVALTILTVLSIGIWFIGLGVAQKAIQKPNSKVRRLVHTRS